MHLGVGDKKQPPSVRPPSPPIPLYEGLGGQGVRGVGGLPKDSTIRIQFEGLSKIIWLFDGQNGVSVITPKYTLALPGGVRGVRGTFHHPPTSYIIGWLLHPTKIEQLKKKIFHFIVKLKGFIVSAVDGFRATFQWLNLVQLARWE